MSKDNTICPGGFHVILRIKGDQARVDLFHSILAYCDIAWPWKMITDEKYIQRTQQCQICDGMVYSSPRCNPEDIKAAAKQANIGVKIDYFAPAEKCFSETERWTKTRWIEMEDAHRVYRSKEWLEKHAPKRVLALAAREESGTSVFSSDGTTTNSRGMNIILPDGTCTCQCHDDGVDTRGFMHQGLFCCSNAYRKRSKLSPRIIEATAVEVDTPEDGVVIVEGIASDRRLMDHVVEAERVAAAAPEEDPWFGDQEPWGGLVN